MWPLPAEGGAALPWPRKLRHAADSQSRNGNGSTGSRLDVRGNWKDQVGIIGLPRFHLDIEHWPAALFLNDAARGLDVRRDFSTICVIGIFRFHGQVGESRVV